MPITFNILLMARGSAHYVSAGQARLAAAPAAGDGIEVTRDGRAIAAIVDYIHTPPGCDEHCIGTLFARER